MLIIGSTAIQHYFPEFKREPKDLDIAVKDKEDKELWKAYIDESPLLKGVRVELLENPVIFKYQDEGYLKPDLLLTLKMSHMFWDNMWDKHMFDIQFLLKKGARYDLGILNELRELWNNILPKVRRSVLAQSKEDFFSNAVNEDTDEHDILHTFINPIPMYTLLLKDGSEVELDENKWNAMSFEQKLEVVREETYVMAWERYKDIDYRLAFKVQLKQNIQKHFPQYIAIFAIENYIQLEKPTIKYRDIINNKLKENE